MSSFFCNFKKTTDVRNFKRIFIKKIRTAKNGSGRKNSDYHEFFRVSHHICDCFFTFYCTSKRWSRPVDWKSFGQLRLWNFNNGGHLPHFNFDHFLV